MSGNFEAIFESEQELIPKQFDLKDDGFALDFVGHTLANTLLSKPIVENEEASTALIDSETVANIINTVDLETKATFRRAIREDFRESESKFKTFIAAVGLLGGQAVDRFRVSVVATPTIAVWAMEQTNNSAVTGLAALSTFWIINKAIGSSVNYGLEEFPESVSAFNEKFPGVVDVFTNTLAGVNSKEENEKSRELLEEKPSWKEKLNPKTLKENIKERLSNKSELIKDFKLHTKRATTCIGIGPTPFVATAAANGYSLDERKKVNNITVTDTAILVGAVGTIVAESIKQLAMHGHPALAEDVQDTIGSPKLWLGIAGFTMLTEYISHKREKRQSKNQ